jgi:hypothetical protein
VQVGSIFSVSFNAFGVGAFLPWRGAQSTLQPVMQPTR